MRSPIEAMFKDALISLCVSRGGAVVDYSAHTNNGGPQLTWKEGAFIPRGTIDCYLHNFNKSTDEKRLDLAPQVRICGYTVDFLLSYFGRVLVVECDGHDWHDRTKQQASYDRARDRALIRAGVLAVLRFTGSDIYRDAEQCADETLKTFASILERNNEIAKKARARALSSSASGAIEEHW